MLLDFSDCLHCVFRKDFDLNLYVGYVATGALIVDDVCGLICVAWVSDTVESELWLGFWV